MNADPVEIGWSRDSKGRLQFTYRIPEPDWYLHEPAPQVQDEPSRWSRLLRRWAMKHTREAET